MRLAVISDMHGNDVAFEAVLADIDRRNCDQIVCLGDAIQGGPQPAEVVERLRARNIPVVMGNADAWLLTGKEIVAEEIPEERLLRMKAAREWSLGKLAAEDKKYIESFLATIRIEFPGQKALLCYHGSPKSFDDLLLPDSQLERFKELLPVAEATFFAGGHTHVQFVRQLGQGFHFNPGSAGFAYRHDQGEGNFRYDHFAEYAILDADEEGFGLEFRRLPFDVDRLVSIYRTSGRPYPEESIAGYAR